MLLLLLRSAVLSVDSTTPGLTFFRELSFLAVAVITIASLGHFATAITEEKEEGTLGLLLLADLSPLSILLGKSTSRVLSALLLLLAIAPFALLSLTLGGIAAGQILLSILILSCYLFLVANVALLISVWARRSGTAIALMTGLMACVHLGPIAIDRVAESLRLAGRLTAGSIVDQTIVAGLRLHTACDIITILQELLSTHPRWSAAPPQMFASLLVGVLCFAAAWRRFDKLIWSLDAAPLLQFPTAASKGRGRAFRGRPGRCALGWKDFHFVFGGWRFWMMQAAVIVAVLIASRVGEQWIRDAFHVDPAGFRMRVFVLGLVGAGLAGANQLYHVERRDGTLTTLLMLPVSPERMTIQKYLAVVAAVLPLLLAAGIQLLFDRPEWPESVRAPAGVALALICGWAVLCQLTVYFSLVVPWGAFPLALGVLVIGSYLVVPVVLLGTFFTSASTPHVLGQSAPLLYVTMLISAGLQTGISWKLRSAPGR